MSSRWGEFIYVELGEASQSLSRSSGRFATGAPLVASELAFPSLEQLILSGGPFTDIPVVLYSCCRQRRTLTPLIIFVLLSGLGNA